MRRLLGGALGGLAVATLGSCGGDDGCAPVGCVPELRVAFSPMLGDGSYKLTLSSPGYDTLTCSFSNKGCKVVAGDCPAFIKTPCELGKVTALVSSHLMFSPTVKLERDGVLLAEKTLTTEYQEVGASCGGGCKHSEVILAH